jgi:molecular chaperone GrpE
MGEENKQGNDSRQSAEPMEDLDTIELSADDALNEECQQLLAKKDEELKQQQDRLLRLAADTENTRKRLEREKTDGIAFANESLIRDLLPVIDNLERAVQHADKEANVESLLTGVQMTLKSFSDTLSRYGCSSFDSVGNPFDPNYHEAVMQQETADHPEMTVINELQRGYTLRDRLIRPALVVVSKAPAEES